MGLVSFMRKGLDLKMGTANSYCRRRIEERLSRKAGK
jgi:hypothetical protein